MNVDDLCNQFRQIFANLKDLKSQNKKIEDENANLITLLEEEVEKDRNNNQLYQNQLNTLQQEQQLSTFNPSIATQQELIDIEQQMAQKQEIFNMLLQQRTVLEQNKNEETQIKQQLVEHLDQINQEIFQMSSNCEQHNQVSQRMRKDIEDMTLKISEYQEKVKQIEVQIKIAQETLGQEQEKAFILNDEFREEQNGLRQLLKTTSMMDANMKETEKFISKSWEELEKKVSRMQTLEAAKNKLKIKIQKAQDQEKLYHQLKSENTEYATKNIQIRTELQTFVKAIQQTPQIFEY